MSQKTYIPDGQEPPASQIGATLQALAATIAARDAAGDASSYTKRLLDDEVLLRAKITEEAGEVAEAASDCTALGILGSDEDAAAADDHLRYEAGDVLYHLLVLLHAHGISLDELAAELNTRMAPDELPSGAILLHPHHINRGK